MGVGDKTAIETYRGCTIYEWDRDPPVYSNSCTAYMRYEKSRTKQDIDNMYAAQEAEKAEAAQPRVVDNYRGYDITYYPSRETNQYYAKVGGHGKYSPSLDAAHAFIDNEIYKQSPEYLQAKADEKAEQDAALERARIYGIGTDEEGNEIPPTEEQIEARETYYAKVKASSTADTVREAYEKREGITITEEEQELREEYQEAELERQEKWFELFWFKLKQEWRNFMEIFT